MINLQPDGRQQTDKTNEMSVVLLQLRVSFFFFATLVALFAGMSAIMKVREANKEILSKILNGF